MGETSPPDEEDGDALNRMTAEKIGRTGETEREMFDEDGSVLVWTNEAAVWLNSTDRIDGEGVSAAEDAWLLVWTAVLDNTVRKKENVHHQKTIPISIPYGLD